MKKDKCEDLGYLVPPELAEAIKKATDLRVAEIYERLIKSEEVFRTNANRADRVVCSWLEEVDGAWMV